MILIKTNILLGNSSVADLSAGGLDSGCSMNCLQGVAEMLTVLVECRGISRIFHRGFPSKLQLTAPLEYFNLHKDFSKHTHNNVSFRL